MTNFLHKGDLPDDVVLSGDLAVDTETKGLQIQTRDRLCVVQISDGSGDAYVVQLTPDDYAGAKNIKALLSDDSRVKLFHYGRFDIAALKLYLGIEMSNVYCTKIASRLCRTYTDRHGLKDLCKELLNVEISKQQQCSDWAADELSPEQVAYAASDVLYLHNLRDQLNAMLANDGRMELAEKCFAFLPERVNLDLAGWDEIDIFAHS